MKKEIEKILQGDLEEERVGQLIELCKDKIVEERKKIKNHMHAIMDANHGEARKRACDCLGCFMYSRLSDRLGEKINL